MRQILIMCALAVVAVAPPVRAQDGSEELPKILAEADVHLRTKSYGAAVKTLERALEMAPTNFEAHYKMGLAFQKLENERAALDYFAKAAKMRPDHLDAQFRYGSMLVATGKTKEAVRPLERVYRDQPDTPGLRASLGRLYFESGDLKKARRFLKKAIREDKEDYHLRYYYAECLFRLERYDDAQPYFESAGEDARQAGNNDINQKCHQRRERCKRRVRKFGLIELGGRRFRNKAYKVSITKPEGHRWGFHFPQQLPPLLVFALDSDDGKFLIEFEAYNDSLKYTIANLPVRPQELGKFFAAQEKEFKGQHKKVRRQRPLRVLPMTRKQQTLCYTATRKSDLRQIDVQITVARVEGTTFRLRIACPPGELKKSRRELATILRTIKFDER